MGSNGNSNTPVASQIDKAIEELHRVEVEIYETDKQLVELRDKKEYILKKYIPKLLESIGTTLIKTPNGFKVSTKKYHYLKVRHKDRLEAYLESRGDSMLMDTVFRIKKLSSAARHKLRAIITQELGGLVAKSDHSLHHSTQRKYINDLLTQHPEELERIQRIGEVSDYFDTRIRKETT